MKQGWEIKRLGDVCFIGDGNYSAKYPKASEFVDSGVPFLTATNLKFGTIVPEGIRYISKEQHATLKKGHILKDDLVIVVRGSSTGNNSIVQTEYEGSNLNSQLAFLRIKKKDLDSKYLFTVFNSPEVQRVVLDTITGSAQPQLPNNKLLDICIPVPPLPEQKRIVAILDKAFTAISKAKANAEQNLKNAKELFDVYLHKFYTNNEAGWEEKKLKEVADYFNGLTYSPKDVSNEGVIVLRSSNVQNDELDFDDIVRVNLTVKEKIIVQEGDILMCSRNGSARLVGKTATIKHLNEKMTFGTFMMIIRSQYNPYLSWFFKSTDFRNQIKGGENTMINQITRYMLDGIVLSFPPIEKQNEIVQKLNALSKEIKKLDTIYNQKINDLEELKKSVLQKAFSGELKTAKVIA